jgi:hypothetical protein
VEYINFNEFELIYMHIHTRIAIAHILNTHLITNNNNNFIYNIYAALVRYKAVANVQRRKAS